MGKIILTTDSTSDLNAAMKEKYGFKSYPLSIIIGNKRYKDSVDITPQMIFDFVKRTQTLPKTEAISADDYKEIFSDLTKDGDTVLHFAMSSEISESYSNALEASKYFSGVYVVDTRVLSSGMVILILIAYQKIREGKTVSEILSYIASVIPKIQTSFVVDSIPYLHKGGKCSSVSMVAKKHEICPYIKMKGGKLSVFRNYRGNIKTVLTKYIEQLSNDYPNAVKDVVFITHATCTPDMIDMVKTLLKQYFGFKTIVENTASCACASHVGRNALGVIFLNDTAV